MFHVGISREKKRNGYTAFEMKSLAGIRNLIFTEYVGITVQFVYFYGVNGVHGGNEFKLPSQSQTRRV